MSSIEYYYPLIELTAKPGIFFDCSGNKQTNFAIKGVMSGTAIEYYIQPIEPADQQNKMKFNDIPATNYLVIKHQDKPVNPYFFYVAFPLITVGNNDMSKYKKTDRMNQNLSKSIDNLNNSNIKSESKVKFSLEHVIDSMKSFEPTSYYKVKTIANSQSIITYVINKPIYISSTINAGTKFAKGIDIKISVNDAPIKTPIKRIKKMRTCAKKMEKKIEPKTMFSNLTAKDQSRVDYLNIIYGFGYLLMMFVFYTIYYKYPGVQKEWMSFTYGIILVLSLIIIPVGTTLQIYNNRKKLKNVKINKSALQHSVIFARYSILATLAGLAIIFSKNLLELIKYFKSEGLTNVWSDLKFNWNRKQDVFKDLVGGSSLFPFWARTVGLGIFLSYLIYLMVYIFLQMPIEIYDNMFPKS